MPPSSTRAPRRLVALVVTLTVVPLAVFLGLGWKLTQQDRAIEAQQRRERLQLDADRVVAAIDRAVSASEQALAAGRTDWPAGVVVVTFKDGTVDVTPTGRVAYVPAVTPRREVPAETFRAAEILEFQRRDRRAAIAAYRRLTMSQDDAVRAGALLRLARNLNAVGEVDQALDAYAALGAINGVTESAVPVSLAAAWGRCAVLAEHGRESELRAEASRFDEHLRAGAWRVAEPVYLAYIADAVRWSGTNRTRTSAEVLAAAVSRVWNDARVYRTGSPGSTRRLITVADDVIAVLTQDSPSTTRMLLAMPSFVSNEWLSAAGSLAAEQRITFAVVPEPEAGSTRLSAAPAGQGLTITSAQNGLPWALTFQNGGPIADEGLIARRRLLIAGFCLLVLLSAAASAAILRAVAREMAVARLQSDFVAAVSHEFRTPLTTLRQFTERLRALPGLSEQARLQCYDAQARATDRLTRLVESVLDFGRMEAGARPYTLGPHDCSDLVERVTNEFREAPQASGRQISLTRNGAMPVDADAEAFSRAVWNLLDNAAKYSPDGSGIHVELSTRRGEAFIAVRDRGFGIAAADRSRLFRRFQRGDEARRLGIKGTGIGLAMVDHIVRAHHGRIVVESEPGAGSIFTIVLPLKG